jgi:hypothetical protein
MKYWTELNVLEESIYQLKKVQSGLNILMDSELFISNSPDIPEKYKTFISDLNDRLDSALESTDESFKILWDSVRNDTFDVEGDDKNRWAAIVENLNNTTNQETVNLASDRGSDQDYR